MKMPSMNLWSALVASVLLTAAAPVTGATISEGSFPGGDFGDAYNVPTLIGNGYDTVTGTTDGGFVDNIDIFAFTGLAAGAQSLTFTFTAPSGIGYSFASGGSIYYSTQPFQWNWDGTYGGTFNLGYFTPTSTTSFSLGSGFAGTLYVGLYGWGSPVSYSISVPGNAPAPVPLPAPAALLLAGLGGFGAVARRPKSRRMA